MTVKNDGAALGLAEPVPVSGDGTSIVSSILVASPDVSRVSRAAAAPDASYATAVRLPGA